MMLGVAASALCRYCSRTCLTLMRSCASSRPRFGRPLRGSRLSRCQSRPSAARRQSARAFSSFPRRTQAAVWDLAAKQVGLPLHTLLGSRRNKVQAYASGLDFHLADDAFVDFFGTADSLGYHAFKIKVGHPDFAWDLHRLELIRKVVRPDAKFMIDANEAWGAKEAVVKLEAIKRAGVELLWVEDPILRHDFDGPQTAASVGPLDADQLG